MWRGLIHRYGDYLPVSLNTPSITLHEGNTVLMKAERIAAAFEWDFHLYLKLEGLNPTGSFKDRGMTVAVSKAAEDGAEGVICASTGNTSASAAAYAARAGMRCIVLVPERAIALGKLAQAITYGAKVLAIQGNFDEALHLVQEITRHHPLALVNSVNPYRLEGQKTAAFELCEQLGGAPDFLSIPVGNAGNISAYWKGFKEFKDAERIDSLPTLLGWQAAGSAPIVLDQVVTKPETVATAIRIGNPASWQLAAAARDESGGSIDMVTDEEIINAYKLLACREGVFVEPASAAAVAGVIKRAKTGGIPSGSTVACVLTGSGLKDPDTALRTGRQPKVVPADYQVIEDIIVGRGAC